MYSLYCKRCGRKLKSEESRKRGYGSYCYSRIAKDEKRDLNEKEVERIEGQLDIKDLKGEDE